MRIEIISIGDELRLGEIADTNAQYIGARLSSVGLELARTALVGDQRDEIASAFREALSRAEIVLATGGLGPTEDDLSREGLADALGVDLLECPEAREMIARRKKGGPLNVMDLRQARAPRGAELIPNPRGSAPGLRAELPQAQGGRLVFVMPGVPHEMKGMFEEAVLPELVRRSPVSGRAVRHLVVFGVPESIIAARVADIDLERGAVRLGTRATDGVITVRVVARAETGKEAEQRAAFVTGEIRERLGEGVVAEGDRTLAEVVAAEAMETGVTLAVAESCTGGMIAARLVASPGVSSVFGEGVVAYSNRAKVKRLGVPAELLDEKGAVSPEVALAMAEGVRRESGADVSVAVTGIAGPDGGTDEKPVGLVYFAASTEQGSEVIERRFTGNREHVRRRSTETALWLLLQHVRRHVPGKAGGNPDLPPHSGGATPTS